MKKSGESTQDVSNVTSTIQSQEISGFDDPNDSKKPEKEDSTEFVCTQRLANLPIVASINSSISEAYTSVKQSHPTVEKIFETTKEGLGEGAKIAAPVTSKIGSTLKGPLKTIDGVICDGLDYLEDNVPAVKLPPAKMYDNVQEYVRNVSENIKTHSNALYADLKRKLEELTKSIEEEPKNSERRSEDSKPGK
ncbi:perilipin-1-like [Venturia canescens]|uniref:perilipin-1-like n=1 Tax=Venturia canescens TaxID=32260 RepID=UPI001C9D49B7|nr:perilipin-1-like [Venturia canescens]